MKTPLVGPGRAVILSVFLACLPPSSAQTFIDRIDGESAFDEMGFSVAHVGDLDGDGFSDVIVGCDEASPGGRLDAGLVFVFSGRDRSTIYRIEGELAGDYFGWSVSGAGDVDGDLIPDFLIGSPFASPNGLGGAGRVYVCSGADASFLYVLDGQATGDALGYAVSDAGDLDGDGFDDLILGAPFASPFGRSGAGRATVVSGIDGSPLLRLTGEFPHDNFGFSVSSAGDINGDGSSDVIVGAPGFDTNLGNRTGAAYVFEGPDGTLLHRLEGDAADLEFGTSVSGVGRVRGIGFGEVAVGAPRASDGGLFRAGHFVVFEGMSGTEIFRIHGRRADDRLGTSVAGAGDVNGDGFADIVSGAPLADPSDRFNAGEVIIAYGPDASECRVIEGFSAGIRFGFSVSTAGDVNGDGYADILTGADEYSPAGKRGAGSTNFYTGESLSTLSFRGNVDFTTVLSDDVLFVNSSAGVGSRREVTVAIDEPLDIFMDRPASKLSGTVRYALYVAVGSTDDSTVRPQVIGGGLIGFSVFPTPVNQEPTSIRRILSNLGHIPIFGAPDIIPARAPGTVAHVPRGARRSIILILQGFIVNDQAPSGLLAMTNAITLRAE